MYIEKKKIMMNEVTRFSDILRTEFPVLKIFGLLCFQLERISWRSSKPNFRLIYNQIFSPRGYLPISRYLYFLRFLIQQGSDSNV